MFQTANQANRCRRYCEARVMVRSDVGPSRWYRLNLWLHRWASLIATVPFLILCLTGTVLIFHEEIDAAMGVVPPAPGVSAASG